jgi:hypothetical protein
VPAGVFQRGRAEQHGTGTGTGTGTATHRPSVNFMSEGGHGSMSELLSEGRNDAT